MFKNIWRFGPSRIRKTSTKTNTITTSITSSSAPTIVTRSTYSLASAGRLGLRCLTDKLPIFCQNKLRTKNTQFTFFERTMSSEASSSQTSKHTNRLAQEKSPYLLQHAHNPVNWYPWCEEAIEKARRENKLIFLSVGYSTCHWCHVMEHESFENTAVANIMNTHFINIKVDREERPDIDKIYMQFVLMMNGSGGWPMSVWLTPDLAPIAAGTYFPPRERWGMPSFTTVLKSIAAKWETNQEELKTTGMQVINAIKKSLTEKTTEATFEPGSADAKLQEALRIFKQRFDQEFGGFGSQPKFPEVSRLNFLFHAYIITKDADVLDMALQSLRYIAKGGIHDHVFGGFARYSVDRVWHVPHFEKMLYDQGQLMSAYANAYKLTRNEFYLRYADGIYRYLMKDLRHPSGGFYSGEDADSLPKAGDTNKVEGAFYAWTWSEVKEAITVNATLFENFEPARVFEIYAFHYDMRPTGNVEPHSDPHGHLTAKNILIIRGSEEETCSNFDITIEQLQKIVNTTNEILYKLRSQRPRPHLDTKIICSWNGLVLSGLAKLSNCGSEKRDEYLQAASELVKFIREHLFDAERKALLRSCYGVGTNNTALESVSGDRIDGFVDDYAFLIKGLLDYYKATLDGSILEWAKKLQDIQDTLFWDEEHGAYFYSKANSPNVIVRLKEDHDGAEPCGNSVAARNLLLLSHYFDDDQYKQRAITLLGFFADVHPFGYTLPEMMSALLLHENGLDLVAVVGPNSDTTKHFIKVCRKFYIPGLIILHLDPEHPSAIHNQHVQERFKMINDKPTVYICHNTACRMPITDPVKLEKSLKDNYLRDDCNM